MVKAAAVKAVVARAAVRAVAVRAVAARAVVARAAARGPAPDKDLEEEGAVRAGNAYARSAVGKYPTSAEGRATR